MAKLFIGMPTFNSARFVHSALQSLLSQTFTDWKILISDNQSLDDTERICRHFASTDKRIAFCKQSQNNGPIANFKYLLEQADSPYFMWAASDDIWDRSFIEKCIEGLEANQDCGLAFSNMVNIDSFGRVIREYPSFKNFAHLDPYVSIASYILEPNVLGKANLIYGVYKLKTIKEFLIEALERQVINFPAADMAIITGVLCRVRIYLNDEVLFQKRLSREGDVPNYASSIIIKEPFAQNGYDDQDYYDAVVDFAKGTKFMEFSKYLIGYKKKLGKYLSQVKKPQNMKTILQKEVRKFYRKINR